MVGTWLITGGCGFIGTATIRALLAANPNVSIRVVDNLSVGSRMDLNQVSSFTECSVADAATARGVSLIAADIRNAQDMIACARGVDCILHLAANTGVAPSVSNPRLDMEQNVVGTLNMLEAARINKVGKFIFASSGAPAGEVEPPIHEEIAPHPVSPYGASKLAGEAYCSAYARTFGVRTIVLRFGNVFGPLSKHKSSVVAKFIRQAIADEICEIFGDGTQTRDFIYIEDLVRAVLCAADADLGGEVFQIASGAEHSVGEIASMIQAELNDMTGLNMRLEYTQPRMGDVKRNYADTSKAKRVLHWMPQWDLRKGIQETIRYFITTVRCQVDR
jgi:UDP-glucose 4-epimerase